MTSRRKPDLAWMRRAAEKARTHPGYIAAISGDIDEVAEDFAITPYQACELFLCRVPRTYAEAQQVARACGADVDAVFHCFVVGER